MEKDEEIMFLYYQKINLEDELVKIQYMGARVVFVLDEPCL